MIKPSDIAITFKLCDLTAVFTAKTTHGSEISLLLRINCQQKQDQLSHLSSFANALFKAVVFQGAKAVDISFGCCDYYS